MKKFKAAVPTVCYTVLLLAIALLSFLIAGKTELTTTSAHTPTTNKTPSPSQENTPVETVYDNVFPRQNNQGNQRIYGEGNVALLDALQTPTGNYVVLSSDCRKGDITSSGPVTAVVKLNGDNDLLCSYQLSSEETFITVRQTAIGIVLITEDADKKYHSVHIIGYDLIGESKYKIPAANTVHVVPTEKDFVLFASYPDECVAYTLRDGKLLFQSIGKYSLVELFEYEDSYVLFCNELSGGCSVLTADKSTLSVTEKQRLSGDKILFVKPTPAGILAVEQGERTYARIYSLNMKERLKEKGLGLVAVQKTYRTDAGVVLANENSDLVLIRDDLTTELIETSDNVLLNVISINGSDRLLFKDMNGNIFFENMTPFTQAEKAIVLPTPNNSLTIITEKKDKYSFIEITDIVY
ncbi:MAG: hypothetical protein J5781_05810 [Clostridia bacterium]|nr:hypothetical protein [Clostridia bacterium]